MFGKVEPPQNHAEELYTPCYLCNNVVWAGLWRFDALELPRTSARETCPPFQDVFREGSVESNYPKLTWKNATHLVISAIVWSMNVQEILMYAEQVYKRAAHFASPLKVYLWKAR